MQKLASRQATVDLLKNRFIFGTQYFRAPTPRPEEWAADLDKIVDLGMDHIRLWALWNHVEPRPGEFQFAAYDRLLELAGERGLGVCINFIFDHVPVWAARRHSAYVLDHQGRPTRTDLLFGGHFACWDSPAMRQEATRLIHAMVTRYRGLGQMLIWDVWNEVKYYPCWCSHTSAAFAAWLRERFATLDALNAAAGTTFGEWDELRLAQPDAKDINLQLLSNQFNRAQLDRQMAWVRDEIRSVDPDTPIMTHSHSWGSVTKGIPMWDDWTVRQQVDLWGASQHILYYQSQQHARNRFAYTIANLESKRAGGPYWLSEMATGILRGGTAGMRQRVAENELTLNMWTFWAHGAKGFTFWQLRPERYSAEAPGWGMTLLDGSETYSAAEIRAYKAVLDEHHDFMVTARPPRERVGVFYHPDSSVLHTVMNRSDHTRLFHGVVYALWRHQVHFRILRDWDAFDGYDTILFPGALTVDDALMAKALAFVRAGGRIVVEAGFGSYAPDGFYRTHVPGDTLHADFGWQETDILPLFDKEVTVELEATGLDVKDLPKRVPMHVGPHTVLGTYDYRRVRVLPGTAVLGLYPDGHPAVLRKALGAGDIVYFGSAVGPYLLECDDPAPSTVWLDIVGITPDIELTATGAVTARRMIAGERCWTVFTNHESRPVSVLWPDAATATPIYETTATWPEFRLGPKGVKVLETAVPAGTAGPEIITPTTAQVPPAGAQQ